MRSSASTKSMRLSSGQGIIRNQAEVKVKVKNTFQAENVI